MVFNHDVTLHEETRIINMRHCPQRSLIVLVYHGVGQTAFWHYAVLLGENRVLEFTSQCGVRNDRPLVGGHESLLEKARYEFRKCPHGDARFPLRAVETHAQAPGHPPDGLMWPKHPLVAHRIHWVKANVRRHHYHPHQLNCEHVVRYVMHGRAVSTQALHILQTGSYRVRAILPYLGLVVRRRRELVTVIVSLLTTLLCARLLHRVCNVRERRLRCSTIPFV